MSMLEKIKNSMEQNKKQFIEEFVSGIGCQQFVILIDVSSSMDSDVMENNGKSKRSVALESIKQILQEHSDKIFRVILFDNYFSVYRPDELMELVHRNNSFPYGGGTTDIHGAIVESLLFFRSNDVILLSDGLPNKSGIINEIQYDWVTDEKALTELRKIFGARLPKFNTIFIPDHNESCRRDGERYMKRLAKLTGGKFFNYGDRLEKGEDPIFTLKSGIKGFLTGGDYESKSINL